MTQKRQKRVLLITNVAPLPSQSPAILFNATCAKMGLPWLAVEKEVVAVTDDDFSQADWIVALDEPEHRPRLYERFPGWAEKVEYWQVFGDDPLPLIEREVADLTARLIGGGRLRSARLPEPVVTVTICSKCQRPHASCTCKKKEPDVKKGTIVRVGRETKGRRSKGVTIVSDLPLDETALLDLAALLKNRCGTGGTVKDGKIEIQGDQRDRLAVELAKLGYQVRRVGG